MINIGEKSYPKELFSKELKKLLNGEDVKISCKVGNNLYHMKKLYRVRDIVVTIIRANSDNLLVDVTELKANTVNLLIYSIEHDIAVESIKKIDSKVLNAEFYEYDKEVIVLTEGEMHIVSKEWIYKFNQTKSEKSEYVFGDSFKIIKYGIYLFKWLLGNTSLIVDEFTLNNIKESIDGAKY